MQSPGYHNSGEYNKNVQLVESGDWSNGYVHEIKDEFEQHESGDEKRSGEESEMKCSDWYLWGDSWHVESY